MTHRATCKNMLFRLYHLRAVGMQRTAEYRRACYAFRSEYNLRNAPKGGH